MKTAMIFAAGMGTRLKPLTDRMPKALVEVCGKPLVVHVLEKLKAAGYGRVVINVHHFADMLENYVRSQGCFGIEVEFSDERERLLETGGGILHARNLIEKFCTGHDGRFLVHNVDILSDLDLRWFDSMVNPGSVASLLVSERKTSRYLLFDGDMRLSGWTNISTGEVKSPYLPGGRAAEGSPEMISCKELQGCRKFAFSGIHSLSSAVFPLMEEHVARTGSHPADGESAGQLSNGKLSMAKFPIMDFYLDICSRHHVQGIVPESLHMVDVGKLDTLASAEEFCRAIDAGSNV
ncbi:MAG: sugar phosphate nucleotidyltransferase [Bacteroidales bacterium]|nr:sugar phosphate nucleotidyltransferase [Bacteroides sp.]MCM1197789.1 sugar phosphate nucleotidyltransferase [Clostridium sp.]MCM1501726.1 sugar phosphate nucleotidyltransferase [Bacteroidales bacterium]